MESASRAQRCADDGTDAPDDARRHAANVGRATGGKGGGEAPPAPKGITIDSPTVGTFYASPTPEDPVFVQVGTSVTPDKIVCIVEAMKVFNQIPAEVSGKIVEVLVKNGDPVEFGQPLFRVDPA